MTDQMTEEYWLEDWALPGHEYDCTCLACVLWIWAWPDDDE